MSDEIIKVLDDLSKRFGVAIDWTSENVMPYLKDLSERIVKYEVVTSTVWLAVISIMFFIVIIASAIIFIKCHYSDEDVCFATIMIDLLLVPTFVAAIIWQTDDIIKCNVFPEKIIVREVNEVIEEVNR